MRVFYNDTKEFLQRWQLGLLIVILLTSALAACQPAVPDFSGRWTTNVGILTLSQEGDGVSGSFEGYGGVFVFTLTGQVSGAILSFNSVSKDLPQLADIVISEDGKTFHAADIQDGFCGARDKTLPDGCGFSGKWKLQAEFLPVGSTAKLTQSGASVTGAAYDPSGAVLAKFDASAEWGKGFHLIGTNEWGGYFLSMTPNGSAFYLTAEDQPAKDKNNREWCGLREGAQTTYVLFFDCAIP